MKKKIINNFYIRIIILFLIMITFAFPINILATINEKDYTLIVKGNETQSNDTNNYLTLEHKPDNSYIWEDELTIYQDYDNSQTPGSSRVTYKIDKDFISNDDNYYDITIEYFDAGIGTILLQSSTTPNNTIDYSSIGYGGYAEESWWSWKDGAIINNITYSLTNTRTYKSHTFKVSDDFFTDGVDNYIHFYYGRDVNYNDTLRIKSISIRKRIFKIYSIDKYENEPILGNIYLEEKFGMGFKIYNTTNDTKKISISYKVYDSLENIIVNKTYEEISIDGKKYINKYIEKPNKYGVYNLEVEVLDEDGNKEIESIKFSKIVKNLNQEINEFVGINTIFGHSGWASERQINNDIKLGELIGINNVRTFINGRFVKNDITNDGYTNKLGRFETTIDSLINDYKQQILFNTDPFDTYVEIDSQTGIITEESFNRLLNETINLYTDIATKYKEYTDYYEILNEWDLIKPEITPEQFAEIQIKTAIAIKKIDPQAKIISVCANKFPIYSNNDYTKFSENSWFAEVLDAKVIVESDLNGNENVTLTVLDIADAISIHPYTLDSMIPNESSKDEIPSSNNSIIEVRRMIDFYKSKYNINKNIPIWITEFGYTSLEHQITQKQQSAYLTRFLIWGLANSSIDKLNIEKMYIWYLSDEGVTNNMQSYSYGILDSYKSDNKKSTIRDVEMSAKESYVAINMYNSLLNSNKIDESNKIDIKDNYYLYEFVNNSENKTIYSIWNNTNTLDKNINVEVINGNIKVYDMYGNILKQEEINNNTITIDVDYTPKYIVVDDIEHTDCLIKFDSSGGNSIENQIIKYKSKVIKPNNPAKQGYVFKEWQLDGIKYNFDEPITKNITLKAIYEKIKTLNEILLEKNLKIKDNLVMGFNAGETITNIKSRIGNDIEIESNLSIITTGSKIKKNNDVYEIVVTGDLNGDGKINSGDLLQMRKYLLEEVSLTSSYKQAGIIESDNEIKSLDLLRLRQYLLGEYTFK